MWCRAEISVTRSQSGLDNGHAGEVDPLELETETGIGQPQNHVDIDYRMQAGTGNAGRGYSGYVVYPG